MTAKLPVPMASRDADCCTQALQIEPDLVASRELARRLKALSDPTRLHLLRLIAVHPGGRACICDLTDPLGVSQPTVSHHMKLLADAGLVSREQKGRWVYYTLRRSALMELAQGLVEIGGESG